MKILFSTLLLAPYRIDWLDKLSEVADIDILCLKQYDSEREKSWLNRLPNKCKVNFMKSIKLPLIGLVSFDFIKKIKQQHYDIILLDGYGYLTQMLNIFFLVIIHKKFFLNIDGIVPNSKKRIQFFLKRIVLKKIPYYLCGSNNTIEYLKQLGVKNDSLIHHPFTSLFKSDIYSNISKEDEKKLLREELNISEHFVIISVGRFTYLNGYGKGYDVLIRSARQLPKTIGWYIIGGEPTNDFVEMKEKYDLINVHYIKFLPKELLKHYYRASDLFVLMTISDVWGLVINEAMACGLPVITTNKCIAGLDLVKNDYNGYLINVGDDISLTEKVKQLYKSKTKIEEMSKNSLKMIQPYTIENMAKIHINIFRKFDN